MANLNLPVKITDKIRNFILQTYETRSQQEEFITFAGNMPPSKKIALNAVNFKKALEQSLDMTALRLNMRDAFRRKIQNVTLEDLNDPNQDLADP